MTKYNSEQVLDLWSEGYPSGTIAVRIGCGSEYVRTIIQRARIKGDARAVSRISGGARLLSGLGKKSRSNLASEAERRGLSEIELATLVLDVVAKAGLFGAVIDE